MAPSSPLTELSIFQIAVVVRDLDAAAAGHTALIGNGPWRVYEFGPHMMSRYEMLGRPATARTLVALNDSRPQVEILQPLSGPSIYQDWLEERGDGLHHIAAIVESVDDLTLAAAADGIEVISSGEGFGTGGSGKFAYLDTQAQLGTILELVEPPAGLGEPLRRI
jgi:methylmalonyl-CoA/ethylmalonyl-CoA epimerase